MATPTANASSTFTSYTTPSFQEAPLAANTIIYGNQPVAINSSGLAVPCDAISGYRFVGFSQDKADNSTGTTGGAAGAANVNYTPPQGPNAQFYVLTSVGATQAWVGQVVYWVDGLSIGLSGANSIICGVVVEFQSSTQVVVNIGLRA